VLDTGVLWCWCWENYISIPTVDNSSPSKSNPAYHIRSAVAIRTLFTAKVDELLYSFNWYTIYEDCWRRVTCIHVLEFVFGHDNFKPSGAAKALNDWRTLSAWSWSDIRMAASSAKARSVKWKSPTVMPTSVARWPTIQSMATRNSTGARTHPCRTPDVVEKRWENLLQILTVAPVWVWKSSVRCAFWLTNHSR